MKTIDLFAGSQSFTNVAREMGCQTWCTDWNPLPGIDHVCDIMAIDYADVPFVPNVIWASPDCAAWSQAAGRTHFDAKSLAPKTDKARLAFDMVDATLAFIHHFLAINPNLKYYIENPQGKMRMYIQPGTFWSAVPRMVVIDQCQYGRDFRKRSHIFTNDAEWQPRPACPGRPMCHHKENINSTPSTKTSLGLLAKGGYYKRAMIPADLCREILLLNLKAGNR